jgi:hypothetical protein
MENQIMFISSSSRPSQFLLLWLGCRIYFEVFYIIFKFCRRIVHILNFLETLTYLHVLIKWHFFML